MTDRYAEIEALMRTALAEAELLLPSSELAEAQQFLDAGEYGLAVESLTDILRDAQKRAPPTLFAAIARAVSAMGMDPENLRDIGPQASVE